MNNDVVPWLLAFAMAILFFYGLDQLIMTAQGLPLNFNLTPANQ